jgi:TrpR-related protein YerC/YecD
MFKSKTRVWKRETAQQLSEVLLAIKDVQTMQNFLRDVMTEKEIIEISSRLEAARMLKAGDTYANITAKTKLSSRTVARTSEWLQNGCNGYQAALRTINTHPHLLPVHAE